MGFKGREECKKIILRTEIKKNKNKCGRKHTSKFTFLACMSIAMPRLLLICSRNLMSPGSGRVSKVEWGILEKNVL